MKNILKNLASIENKTSKGLIVLSLISILSIGNLVGITYNLNKRLAITEAKFKYQELLTKQAQDKRKYQQLTKKESRRYDI